MEPSKHLGLLLFLLMGCRTTAESPPRGVARLPAEGAEHSVQGAGGPAVGYYQARTLSLGACEVDIRPPTTMSTVQLQQQPARRGTGHYEIDFEIRTVNIHAPVRLWVVAADDPGGTSVELPLAGVSRVTVRVPNSGTAGAVYVHPAGAPAVRTLPTKYVFHAGTNVERKAREFEDPSLGHYSVIQFAAFGKSSGFGIKSVP